MNAHGEFVLAKVVERHHPFAPNCRNGGKTADAAQYLEGGTVEGTTMSPSGMHVQSSGRVPPASIRKSSSITLDMALESRK